MPRIIKRPISEERDLSVRLLLKQSPFAPMQSILDLMHPMDFQKQYPAPKSSHFSLSKASELFERR